MRLSSLILAITGALAMAGAAKAETVAAMAGHGWPTHADGCFGSSWQLMQNNCSGTAGSQRLLVIPAQHSSQGYTMTSYATVNAMASGNGTNGMTNCQAISLWTGGGNLWSVSATQIVSTTTSAARQWLSLGPLSVTWSGTLHFECFVAQGGGQVHYVHFQQ